MREGIITTSLDEVLAGGAHLLHLYSNQAHVNADSALLKVHQDSSSATEPVLEVDNDGTGAAIEIDDSNAAGNGIKIATSTNRTGGGLLQIDITGTQNQGASHFVHINNAASGNIATMIIDNGCSNNGLRINQNAVNYANSAFEVYSNAATVQADSALVKFTVANASQSEPALEIDYNGSIYAVEIDAGVATAIYAYATGVSANGYLANFTQSGTNHGVLITHGGSIAQTHRGFQVSGNGTTTDIDAPLVRFYQSQSGTTEPALQIDHIGSGSALEINASSTGYAIFGTGQIYMHAPATRSNMVFYRDAGTCDGDAAVRIQNINTCVRTTADSPMLWLDENHASNTEPMIQLYSNTSTGTMIEMDHNGNGMLIYGDTEATTSDVIDIRADVLTSGTALRVYSNSSALAGDWLTSIEVDHASATSGCLNLYNDGSGNALRTSGSGNKGIYLGEMAAAGSDTAAYGQIWVKNDTPNTLYFTDDAGTDFKIGGAGVAGATYDSGWFAVTTNTEYTKTHNLGTTNVIGMIWFSDSATGASNVFQVYERGSADRGGHLQDLTTTQVNAYTDTSAVAERIDGPVSYASGYYRIILIACG